MPILWVAILLYDYCLTFVAEVERCWSFRLNWALALFYLNRYLVLFGHVPIVVQYFWSTSDPNKLEVSFSQPKIPGDGGTILMPNLPDVSIYPSLSLKHGEEIHLYILSSCHGLQIFHVYLAIVVQAVVACRPIILSEIL